VEELAAHARRRSRNILAALEGHESAFFLSSRRFLTICGEAILQAKGSSEPMDPEQAIKEIEKGVIRPLYVLYGEEYYYTHAIMSALRLRVAGESDAGMCLSEYDGAKVTAAQVLDDLRTLTFFGGTRLVIVENADAFLRDNKEVLGKYGKSPTKVGCLALVCEKKPDARFVFAKAVEKSGAMVSCTAPKAGRLVPWVRKRARELGSTISGSAAQLLIEIVGADLAQLDSHLRTLVTYVGDKGEITDRDVARTVEEEKTVPIWDLMDGVAAKNGKMALEALDRLLPRAGMEAARLSQIGTALLNLLRVKKMVERFGDEAKVAQALNMHPFVVKKNIRYARKFSRQELGEDIRKAFEADVMIKSHRMARRLAVEKLIAELCK